MKLIPFGPNVSIRDGGGDEYCYIDERYKTKREIVQAVFDALNLMYQEHYQDGFDEGYSQGKEDAGDIDEAWEAGNQFGYKEGFYAGKRFEK